MRETGVAAAGKLISAQFERLVLCTYPVLVMLLGAAGGRLSCRGLTAAGVTHLGPICRLAKDIIATIGASFCWLRRLESLQPSCRHF